MHSLDCATGKGGLRGHPLHGDSERSAWQMLLAWVRSAPRRRGNSVAGKTDRHVATERACKRDIITRKRSSSSAPDGDIIFDSSVRSSSRGRGKVRGETKRRLRRRTPHW